MWEEHPAYQKAQAAAIGVGLVLLLLAGIVYCVSERNWPLLGQVLLFAGTLVLCLVLLSLTARLLVRIFTRRHK
jgi:hypothetical protein